MRPEAGLQQREPRRPPVDYGRTFEGPRVFHLHGGASLSLIIAALACLVPAGLGLILIMFGMFDGQRTGIILVGLVFLAVPLLVSIWYFSALIRSKLRIEGKTLIATCLITKRIDLTTVDRLGLFQAPSASFMHALMYGASSGTVLWIKDRSAITTKVHVYMYENVEEILRQVSNVAQQGYVTIRQNWLGADWPSNY
jgi:hypothetical protein